MKRSKIVRLSVCVILVMGLSITFCTWAIPKEKEITISAGSAFKAENLAIQGTVYCLKEAARRSGFKLELKEYWSGTLAKVPEDLTLLSKGGVDAYQLPVSYYKDRMPLWTIPNSLPLVTGDCFTSVSAMYEYAKWKPAQEELRKNNLHFMFPGWYDFFIVMGKPIRSIADLKGYKIRPFGLQAKSVAKLGGVPITLSGGEIIDAMTKGTIDGGSFGLYNFGVAEHFDEVSQAYSFLNFGAVHPIIAMNLNKYNSLPEAYRKALDEVCMEMVYWYDKQYNKLVGDHLNGCRRKGKPMLIPFPKEDQLRVIEVGGRPVWDEIAQEYETKGLPGREAVSNWTKYIEIQGKKSKREQWPDWIKATEK
jgi:TRAP-type C4-dicarboxylate transport system substrate-binding protein